jgi:hypothetical protein
MIKKCNIVVNKTEIKNKDMTLIRSVTNYGYSDWDLTPGKSEYCLYEYISNYFENTLILDIGTGGGGSSKAFGANLKNKVISFDLSVRREIPKSDNIEYRLGEFTEDKTLDYSNVSIIMIDVDPHDGIKEPIMIKYLEEINWSGILILDDIKFYRFPDLEKYWNELPYEKYDLTDIGHDSGTGLINFGSKHNIMIEE